MPVKLICASHTPLMDFCSPGAEVERAVRDTFATLPAEVRDYHPELVVVFGPDHFNGFFYDLMPSFCIGVRAAAAGDWDIGHGPLAVPEAQALDLVKAVLADDVDVAFYYGRGNWPGLRADKLHTGCLIPVCLPLLLASPKPLPLLLCSLRAL